MVRRNVKAFLFKEDDFLKLFWSILFTLLVNDRFTLPHFTLFSSLPINNRSHFQPQRISSTFAHQGIVTRVMNYRSKAMKKERNGEAKKVISSSVPVRHSFNNFRYNLHYQHLTSLLASTHQTAKVRRNFSQKFHVIKLECSCLTFSSFFRFSWTWTYPK